MLVDFGIARERRPATAGHGRSARPSTWPRRFSSERRCPPGATSTGWRRPCGRCSPGRPPSYDDPTRLADRVAGVSRQLERTLRAALRSGPSAGSPPWRRSRPASGRRSGPARGGRWRSAPAPAGAERPARADRPDDGGRLRGRGGVDRARRPRHVRARLRGGVGKRSRRGGRHQARARSGPGGLRRRVGRRRGDPRLPARRRASPRRSRRRPATSPTRCWSFRSSAAVT